MKALVLDLETTVQILGENTIDNSPYNPKNKIVSANWRYVDTDKRTISSNSQSVFYHKEKQNSDSPRLLQQALDWADIVVAHNAKYDVEYLLESNFRLPKKVHCTMIGEYILARGVKKPLSLDATAKRRKTTLKKGDLVDAYWDQGIGFDQMPLDIVLEYADADVLSCAEIYLQQIAEFHSPENNNLHNILDLMNDMLWFLVEIERNGVKVDLDILDQVAKDYIIEREQITSEMDKIIASVMGDTPINLNSGDDVTKVIFSRRVTDKHLHKEIFNIGVNDDGKPLWPPRMSNAVFASSVRRTTEKVYRTIAKHCEACHGKGSIQKYKKNKEPYKNRNKCKVCDGVGFVYIPTNKIAGFKLSPERPSDASINGFKVGKDELDRWMDQARRKDNEVAVRFLECKKRLNVINTYLNSFVAGIKRWTRENNVLHPTFNQAITATGRLSSSDPNFQNQPKGKKFPVRKAVISRFEDGIILEADFNGLEFTIAGELSRDSQIISDVINGKDIHTQTATIVKQCKPEDVDKETRNSVKPDSFAPLYGATGMGKPAHVKRYYEEFFVIYHEHKTWQIKQMDDVLTKGVVTTPSGREYAFPGTRRIRADRTTNATKIVNYPVQGFATGDIVPLACIRALRIFKRENLKSLLILTVHDSIVVDCHPEEIEQVKAALTEAMCDIPVEIKERFNYDMVLPLNIEIEGGPNWMELNTI